jgi:hypothetical protein
LATVGKCESGPPAHRTSKIILANGAPSQSVWTALGRGNKTKSIVYDSDVVADAE